MKAIQQLQIGKECKSYQQTLQMLKELKNAGFEGIELNSFMLTPLSFKIKTLLKLSGMSIGNCDKLDWHRLIEEANLEVVSIHESLESLTTDRKTVIKRAKSFQTNNIVLTGIRNYNYQSQEEADKLIRQLNEIGRELKSEGLNLLYHNHNVELVRLNSGKSFFEYLIENTDPDFLNFELDVFWLTEAGADVSYWIAMIGSRLKLLHLTDRGFRTTKASQNSIQKSDCVELGFGNMNLESIICQSQRFGVEGIIVETHRNWVENSGFKSAKVSIDYLNKYYVRN